MDLGKNIPYVNITLFQVLTSILIIIAGWIIVKIVLNIFKNSLKRTKVPPLLSIFLSKLFSIILYIGIILIALANLGIQVSSAVLGLSAALGLVFGFGLKDTINNLAAGVWLSTIRPFYKDEHVLIDGMEGNVHAVGLMSTEIMKADNTYITLPNSLIWQSPIVNYSRKEHRRVDIDVGIAYGEDIDKAIRVAMDAMKKHKMVLDDPQPNVTVNELADSSINLTLKPWSENEDYWKLKHDLTKIIYNEYNKAGIEIPNPQMDVHLDKGK
ncbi:MAG: mechanosensitive ion channel family protein [Thermoplasmatota archaeon]